MTSENSKIINYKDFLKRSGKRPDSAGLWRWKDIESGLADAFRTDPVDPGRAAVSLTNGDAGGGVGVGANVNVLVQAFKPNEHGTAHRHSNFAIFIVREGSGYSIIDGKRIDWSEGDVFFAPPWSRHEHCNVSATQRAVLYTIQDVPMVSNMGVWFFQGADGSGFKHNIPD